MAFSLSRLDATPLRDQLDQAARAAMRAGREVNLFSRAVAEASRDMITAGAAASHGSAAGAAAAGAAGKAGKDSGETGTGAAAVMASRMAGAINSGMIPIGRTVRLLQDEFNRLAGTMTTLARRIDAAMKFPWMDAQLTKIREFGLAFAASGPMLINGIVRPVNQAAKMIRDQYVPAWGYALLAANAAATGANVALGLIVRGAGLAVGSMTAVGQTIYRAQNFLSSLGDVAKKPLDVIKRITFDAPIAGARRLAQTMPLIGRGADGASASIRNLGRDLLAALGIVGVMYKAFEFFKGGIAGAVALNETVNATKLVFQNASGAVIGFADDFANKYGIVKNTSLEMANGFGEMGQAAGLSAGQSARFATDLTRLTANFSSLKNIKFEDAGAKIRSALAGASEPLRPYGVLLTEALVKSEALRLGLGDAAGEVSEGAKIMARSSLVQQALARANGDLARTAGDAANQFRRAGGGLTNFAASIGTAVMPAVKAGAGAFNDLLATIVEVFVANQPMIQNWAEMVAGWIGKVGLVARNLGDYFTIAKLKTVEAIQNTAAVMSTLPENASRIASYIGRNWHHLIVDAINLTMAAFKNFGTYLGELSVAAFEWMKNPLGKFEAPNWTPLTEGFQATAEALPELLKPQTKSMQREIDAVYARILAKERERQRMMQQAAAGDAAGPPIRPALGSEADAAKGKDRQFAGLAEKNSKEAVSAVFKAKFGGVGDPIDKLHKTVQQQLDVQRQQLEAQRAAARPPAVFGMGS